MTAGLYLSLNVMAGHLILLKVFLVYRWRICRNLRFYVFDQHFLISLTKGNKVLTAIKCHCEASRK